MKRSFALIGAATFGAAMLAATVNPAQAGFTVFEVNAVLLGGIQPTVDNYRTALGALNANSPGSVGSGRREINWDGVPAASSDPNLFAGNFFNANVAGRARGVEFTTPGTGFLVSAAGGGATPVRFGFPTDFVPFSEQKLFSPIGSVITDVRFFVPGSSTAATVSGFGAVFNDVEIAGSSLQAFDENGVSLFSRQILLNQTSGSLSFLGILANAGERISRVRLVSGDMVLLSNGTFAPGTDAVVFDDFIYGEPVATSAVPVPASLLLLSCGMLSMLWSGWSRGRTNRA